MFSSITSDRIGRRDTMFIACLVWLVGSSVMAAVQNVAMLIVARIINGFAVGMLTSQGYVSGLNGIKTIANGGVQQSSLYC
jgi:MFS family permease